TSVCSLPISFERALQKLPSGVKMSLSAANSATMAIAPITRTCWRFLICTLPSFHPLKIESEIQRRFIAANGHVFNIRYVRLFAQEFDRSQERLLILRHAAASH